MKTDIPVSISAQPDDTTCGPTCLKTIYNFYDDNISLEQVIDEVPTLLDGGTLGAWLATHALKRGYRVTIYSYNLNLFDPTWYGEEAAFIKQKLVNQAALKGDPKLKQVTEAYIAFLDAGGELEFEVLQPSLIRSFLNKGIPILTGLSATFLYRSKRELGTDNEYDDLRGEPVGHFVVLHGYDRETKTVMVADPLLENPLAKGHQYEIEINRVINAILLSIVTYDANLIIIRRPEKTGL